MIPGVSRSGASIVGGMTQNYLEQPQQNFFFSCYSYHARSYCKKSYDYYKAGFELSQDQINLLIIEMLSVLLLP